MPLDQVISLFLPITNCLNVVLVKSMDLLKPGTISRDNENEKNKENIGIGSNSICWNEKRTEHRIRVGDYFKIVNMHRMRNGELSDNQARKFADYIRFNLKLRDINLELLMRQTQRIDIMDLRINLVANKPFSLHCSNCATELIPSRAYSLIDQIPFYPMRVPYKFRHCLQVDNISSFDQIYYGLNQIVMSAEYIKRDTEMIYCRKRRRVLCPGCPRVLGTFLSRAVCLHADALCMGTRVSHAARLEFNELFGHITPTQLMLRLMQNAEQFRRMFLKAVRPDGQVHYLLLMTDVDEMQFLRSKLSLTSKTDTGPLCLLDGETRSESKDGMDISSESNISSLFMDEDSPNTMDIPGSTPRPSLKKSNEDTGCSTGCNATIPKNATRKSIHHVFLTPYNGYRVRYTFASTDSELRDIHYSVMAWRAINGRPLLISYSMMIELVSELNANEHLAAALDPSLVPPCHSKKFRFSHIIFESDEEFYATQQQLDVVQVT
ncbi:uncharacterized protein LOC117586162 [Drosophila guanche]|uniref:HECT-type E3 ubiquitin transferase E3D n=1 Tax=Drosophila guanche TaxID=7266 RepID=A0A3B0KDU1_DROGU|nr:uncharacterized protein LOC117586162 [Drosophila guanche]SPP84439.1 Hypothetical predicted protein [Drosophila guanche]